MTTPTNGDAAGNLGTGVAQTVRLQPEGARQVASLLLLAAEQIELEGAPW